jgi:exopolysaccharide biosynthesis polyprenyl glycosylphosphotransferase
VQKRVQLLLKRVLDIAASSAGIVVLSPLLLSVALLIKMTSHGPVLFKQERIGLGGKKFRLYKFRSMFVHNDPAIHQEFVKKLIAGQAPVAGAGEHASYKIQNDPRVTSIGRFIRKTSIDELPQLFNVLVGNMSLVGPRPPIGYEVEVYEVWHRPRVVEIRPGITGLWQVMGRSKTTFDGMVRMDLEYIHNWSLWLDVKLLLKTPAAVVAGKGAY